MTYQILISAAEKVNNLQTPKKMQLWSLTQKALCNSKITWKQLGTIQKHLSSVGFFTV